jgi:hypothetical protein
MNCSTAQHHLLASENPGQPSTEVVRHLARCSECLAIQRRLIEIEQLVPLLPVPPSSRRDVFVRSILQGETVLEPTVSTSDLWLSPRLPAKERGLKKLALAFAMAAALVVCTLGWWAWPHKSTSVPGTLDPIATRQQQRDRKLAAVHKASERVAVLNDLARQLHQEALQLVKRHDDEELRVVARFYTEVVHENLLDNAGQLSATERKDVLDSVAAHLQEVESSILRMLAEVPDSTAVPLRDIAQASSQGRRELRKMIDKAAA